MMRSTKVKTEHPGIEKSVCDEARNVVFRALYETDNHDAVQIGQIASAEEATWKKN